MTKKIHIVSFDVPFPPDYGGIVDVYNRAKTLKENGFQVVLHAFEYGRGRNHDFTGICDEIHYYKRKNFLFSFLKGQSYISSSRVSQELIQRLNNSQDLLLLEGQHCAALLPFLNRKAALRIHNIEWQYYAELGKREQSVFKRWYFKRESKCLKREEAFLKSAILLCVEEKEVEYYTNLGFDARLVPNVVFQDPNTTEAKDYALFHGNLSVNENQESAKILMNEVTKNPLSLPLIVAGKNPPNELKKILAEAKIELVESPNDARMQQLMQEAKVHIVLSYQATGTKLKLLNSLATHRPVVVNQQIIEGTGMSDLCIIWNDENTLAECVDVALAQKTKQRFIERLSPENYCKTMNNLNS